MENPFAEAVQPPPSSGSGSYSGTVTASHSSIHSIYTNAMLTKTANASQAYNAYNAAAAHFNNVWACGLGLRYQGNMQTYGYRQPSASQVNAVYNSLVSTYTSHITFSECQSFVAPDATIGQQAFNYVLNGMGGIWNSYQAGVTVEHEQETALGGGIPVSNCRTAVSNVQLMFEGIAAVFGVAALIDPPALGVAAAAVLVAFSANLWGRLYCS